MKGDGDQIGVQPEIDRLYCLIDMGNSPMRWNEGGQIRHGDLLKVQDAGTPYLLDLARGGGDQQQGWHDALAHDLLR
jgi:hypothetical protein